MKGFIVAGLIMIICGFLLGSWAYSAYRLPEFQRAVIFQGPLGSLIHMVCTLAAFFLKIAGVIWFFV